MNTNSYDSICSSSNHFSYLEVSDWCAIVSGPISALVEKSRWAVIMWVSHHESVSAITGAILNNELLCFVEDVLVCDLFILSITLGQDFHHLFELISVISAAQSRSWLWVETTLVLSLHHEVEVSRSSVIVLWSLATDCRWCSLTVLDYRLCVINVLCSFRLHTRHSTCGLIEISSLWSPDTCAIRHNLSILQL